MIEPHLRLLCLRKILRLTMLSGIAIGLAMSVSTSLEADQVSFLVDPTTIDDNMDGFITGTEFEPVGSDGVIFGLVPTDNLVGAPRFLLSDTRGLQFGGGGGSTLSFDFTVSQAIQLEEYTLASSGFILGNPLFNITDGATILSMDNTAEMSGQTYGFAGGPISLDANTTYSFETTVTGAGIQSFMESWTYSRTAVPEPSSLLVLAGLGTTFCIRRRRSS